MCVFCNFDSESIENTIIDETDNFYVLPAVGSLVDGYLLIVTKRHVNSMADLTDSESYEYIELIDKYRKRFKSIYKRYPIIFEHGTPKVHLKNKASSVDHAHTHIVNHNYLDEGKIIEDINFKNIDSIDIIKNDKNYILYINPLEKIFVSYNFPIESQLMRKMIAADLGIHNKYNWKNYDFINNIKSTIDKFK